MYVYIFVYTFILCTVYENKRNSHRDNVYKCRAMLVLTVYISAILSISLVLVHQAEFEKYQKGWMGVWISCKPSDHGCLVACYLLLKNQMRWNLHDKDLASLDAIGFTSSIKTQMEITLTLTNKLHLCEWMSNEYLLVQNSVVSAYWLSKSRSSHIQYPQHTGLIDIDCTSHHLHSRFSQVQDTSKSSHWCQKHPTVVLFRVPITVNLQVCDDFGETLEAQVWYIFFWGGVSRQY